MKKLALSLAVAMVLVPSVSAAQIASDYFNALSQNQTETIFPINITASADAEITAEHGINLILNAEKQILWDDVATISATGTAVTAEKISASITPEYKNNYKIVHIPVLADFASGESVKITGLAMRAYNRSFDNLFMGMDLNGDNVADATDVNSYKVTSDTATDHTPPYAPSDFKATVASNLGSVSLSWGIPADYDLVNFTLERIVNGGVTQTLFSTLFTSAYTDNDVHEGDSIVYTVYARDQRNLGEKAEVTVVVGVPEEEEVAPEPVEEPVEEVVEEEPAEEEVSPEGGTSSDVSSAEIANLNKYFNYYKLRYNIKCHPAGRTVPSNDSACLWARIDMVYAQEVLDKSTVDVSLSAHDLELMAKRRRFPEERYQTYCEEASVAAPYCSALGKALDRIGYFLD